MRDPIRKLLLVLCLLGSWTGSVRASISFEILKTFHASPFSPSAGLVADPGGNLYGTVELGGAHGFGGVYKVSSTGTVTFIYEFEVPLGSISKLFQGSDGWLYGTSVNGGSQNGGCLFRVSKSGEFQLLHDFLPANTSTPLGEVIEISPGEFVGTTVHGGQNNCGTLYRYREGSGLNISYHFGSNEGNPTGPLTLGSDGMLYGGTIYGLYRVPSNGVSFELLYKFPTDGNNPPGFPLGTEVESPLTLASDGKFYGVTQTGGDNDCGTFFSLSSSGTVEVLHHFDDLLSNGSSPAYINGGLVEGPDGLLYGTSYFRRFRISKEGAFELLFSADDGQGIPVDSNIIFVGSAMYYTTRGGDNGKLGAIVKHSPTEGYETIHRFGVGDGFGEFTSLLLASDGNLYTNMSGGGPLSHGGILRIKPDGSTEWAYVADRADTSSVVYHGLAEGPDQTLYGIGVLPKIFKFPLNGGSASFKDLESGQTPIRRLVKAGDGSLYTISISPGYPFSVNNISRLEETAEAAKLTSVYAFPRNGDEPVMLSATANGTVYGNSYWSVFRLGTSGEYSVLRGIDRDVDSGFGSMSEGFDGALYGSLYGLDSSRKFIKLTPQGDCVVIRKYPETGAFTAPYSMLKANDGNFYGISAEGLLRITPAGDVELVHPLPALATSGTVLALAKDGAIYGLMRADETGEAVHLFRFVLSHSSAFTKSNFATVLVNDEGDFEGALNLQLTSRGRVSGTYKAPGYMRRFKGNLDANGNMVLALDRRADGTPIQPSKFLQLKLNLDVSPPQLVALVYQLPSTSVVASGRTVTVESEASSLPDGIDAGPRTLRFSLPQNEVSPNGYGWATGTIKPSGAARFAGKLADGTPFSCGFKIQLNGMGLIQVSKLKPDGWIFGDLDFTLPAGAAPNGFISCKTSGFGAVTERFEAFIAPYHRPSALEKVLTYVEPILDAEFTASGFDPLSGSFNILAKDKAVAIAPNELRLRLSIERTTGRFQGTFAPAESAGLPVKFSGVFDQTAQMAFGFFKAEGFGGSVKLTPRAPVVEGLKEAN
jgi:uncharacterized repeat protein (TIGR03803 family)